MKTSCETGEELACFLRTAWRTAPDAPGGLALEKPLASLLLDTGCGALGWWRVHDSPLVALPDAHRLQQAFRLHALEAARRERDLEIVLCAFNAAQLEPILFKGWTLSRVYALPALRPFGDFDILVEERDSRTADRVISNLTDNLRDQVDLDMRVLSRFLPDRTLSELVDRSTIENIGKGRFRLLAPEDHLRLICLHQLDHGAWRPLWLCDIAAFLERITSNFNWDLCLTGNPNLSDSVIALVSLAEELLSADLLPATPNCIVPVWFRRAVLASWAGGYQAPPAPLHTIHRLGWRRALGALRARWPDPISSTLHLRAPFRRVPRPLVQLAELFRRAFTFIRRTSAARKHRNRHLPSLSTVRE